MVGKPAREVSKYVSPDGLLTFVVLRYPDDVALGFDGQPWHTHGDIIACFSGLPEDETVQRYVGALLDNRSVVAVHTVDGRVKDIWIDDDPFMGHLDEFRPGEGELALRLWDGTPVAPDHAGL